MTAEQNTHSVKPAHQVLVAIERTHRAEITIDIDKFFAYYKDEWEDWLDGEDEPSNEDRAEFITETLAQIGFQDLLHADDDGIRVVEDDHDEHTGRVRAGDLR